MKDNSNRNGRTENESKDFCRINKAGCSLSTVRSHPGNRAKRFFTGWITVFGTFWALKIHDFARVGCHLEDHFQWNDQGRITGVRDDLWDIFFLIFATFLALKIYHFARVGCHLGDRFFKKRPGLDHEGERRSVGHFFFWHFFGTQNISFCEGGLSFSRWFVREKLENYESELRFVAHQKVPQIVDDIREKF